jgi:uncharacterized SAM-binding protein YcdF (DUF218 family)
MMKPIFLIRCHWLLILIWGFWGSLVLYLGLALVSLPLETYLVYVKPITQADAIVVMAGNPSERLPAASFLFKQGAAVKIILTNDGVLSSWSELFQRNLYEIEWAEQALIKAGIPEQAIVKLPFSESGTYFDTQHTVEYALGNKIDSLIIVTSGYHTKRTYRIFNQMIDERDIELGTYPTYPTELVVDNFWSTYKRSKQLFVEFIKLIYYEIKYGF